MPEGSGGDMAVEEQIRQVIAEHARLPVDVAELDDHADLFQAGMTSHASVNVMLALEEAFDVEFPESMLRKATFESVSAIRAALVSLESMAV
jgi:acyl carrier protein